MDNDSGPLQIPHVEPSPGGANQPPTSQPPVVPPQPTQVVTPSATLPPTPAQQTPANDDSSWQLPAPQPQAPAPTEAAEAGNSTADTTQVGDSSDASGWEYNQEDDGAAFQAQDLPEDITWTAAEFVEHPKSSSWYAMLMGGAVLLSAIVFIFTRDFISIFVILFAAALLGVYAGHKPRMQQYLLTANGLQIGEKTYDFQAYKAFSVADEGGNVSILFMPLGRFAPPLTIYVTREIEDKVIDYLSLFLPIEQRRRDAVDGILRRIRF